MQKQILIDLNLNQNEIQNAVLHNLSANPQSGVGGQLYYNTTNNKPRYFNGTDWVEFGPSSGSSISKYSSTLTADSSTTQFTVTHNLGTRDVTVNVYDSATYESVTVDIVMTTENTITVNFATAPTTGTDYRVVVIG